MDCAHTRTKWTMDFKSGTCQDCGEALGEPRDNQGPGSVSWRFSSLMDRLQKRFPNVHSQWSSAPGESKYIEAIDKLIAGANVDTSLPCNQLCPKCGSDDVSLHYHARNSHRNAPNREKVRNKYAYLEAFDLVSLRDHIDNNCRRCFYNWQSLPLPKKKKSPEGPERK